MPAQIKTDAVNQKTDMNPCASTLQQNLCDFITEHVSPKKKTADIQCPGGASHHISQGLQRLLAILMNCEVRERGDLRKTQCASQLPGLCCRFIDIVQLIQHQWAIQPATVVQDFSITEYQIEWQSDVWQ